MKATKLKRTTKSIFIGLIAITTFPIMASSGTSTPGNGDAILTKEEQDPFLKRMPSRMRLHLLYADGYIEISSDHYIGEFSISLENCETFVSYEVPSIQVGQSVPLELTYGEYQVTAMSEDGTVLSGYMQVY